MGVEWRKGAWHLRLKMIDGVWRYQKTEARTKHEAELLAAEENVRLERQRRGLEPLEMNPRKWTLAQLMNWWLENRAKPGTVKRATSAIKKHILGSRFASTPIDRFTTGMAHDLLADVKGGAVLHRHVRDYLHVAFRRAIDVGHFFGANPVTRIERVRAPEAVPVFLELDEIKRLLVFLDAVADDVGTSREGSTARQRALVYALAVFTGMRRGEIWALRWIDVDLRRGRITIRRSNDRDVTKSGKPRTVRIVPDLFARLETAKKTSSNELVCPGFAGEMRSSDAKAAQQLRADLRMAGVERHDLNEKAKVKLRFHDLRHTFASWWLMKGNDLTALSKQLGHSTIDLTLRRYGHLSNSYIDAQWARFNLDPEEPATVVEIQTRKAR